MKITLDKLTIIGQAARTSRLFNGCFNDGWTETIGGEDVYCYWDEMSANAVDADGKKYVVTWHQKQIRDQEIDDDCWDWGSPESINEY